MIKKLNATTLWDQRFNIKPPATMRKEEQATHPINRRNERDNAMS
jgi:hypothetical protein